MSPRYARFFFALGLVSVAVLTLVLGYGVLLFAPAPPSWTPWLKAVGYASAVIMLVGGAGLLFERTARVATRVLLPFFLLWTLSRVPAPLSDPAREISWFAVGEIAVLAAAAIVLFSRLAGLRPGSALERFTSAHALTVARFLFGPSLVTFGLSHFFEFAARTVSLVPAWLPYRTAWADLAGAAQIAAGLGVLLWIYPRASAALEAAMLSAWVPLIWIPAVVEKPALHSNWGELIFTFALAGASWVVAEAK